MSSVKKTNTKVQEPKVQKVVRAKSIDFFAPNVKTFSLSDTVNYAQLTAFQELLRDVNTHNRNIEHEEAKHKAQQEFNSLHKPDAEPEFYFSEPKIERIYLFVNSYGGYCAVMQEIADLIENSTVPIDTVCFGVAMSAGYYIFVHGKNRYIGENTQMMTHSSGGLLFGKMPDMKTQLEHELKMNKLYQKRISEKTGIPLEVLIEQEKSDWYMLADEILENSSADYIIK